MSEKSFASLGRVEAVSQLYEGTSYKAFENSLFEIPSRGFVCNASLMLLEGIDFDLVYFPLKHLGYKSVTGVTGELYANMSKPEMLRVNLGVSSKLDFAQVKELFDGIALAAREHGYKSVSLDLAPSRNGLCICLSASGQKSALVEKRKAAPKSMDLICVSGNLGAAFFGMKLLEREKEKFAKTGVDSSSETLKDYKLLVGSYLKPELSQATVANLEDSDIIPTAGYFVNRGLGDALRRLTRDTGLGAKVYVDKIPFAGRTFDLGKEFDIDPVAAAFNGGEDYRLLFTVPIVKAEKFRRDFQTFDVIGHLAKPEVGTVIVTPDGLEHPVTAQGWTQKQ